MKIIIISDTHIMHHQLPIIDCDVIIHCGDESNQRSEILNEAEFLNFWNWWEQYPATIKKFVPGNHSSFISHPMSKTLRRSLKPHHHILVDDTIIIDGVKFFGSPWTPIFHDWVYMLDRAKLHKHWALIEPDTDIVITHGPPKGILDTCYRDRGMYELGGDKSLLNKINEIQPLIHCFGHVHVNQDAKNAGIYRNDHTTFINASCVTDGEFDKGLSSYGYELILEDKKIISLTKINK